MNATPWGTSASHSESAFSNQQSSQVVQAFQPVLGLLGQMQGSLSGGAMSQSAASSYVNQLVSQLQPALNGINACSCFGAPSVGSVINNVFSQLSQVMQSFQSNFGGAFGGIVSPFQQIAPTFQSFFQQSQQSSSFNSFSQSINPFINVMQPFIPSFGGLSSFGGFSQQSSSQGSQSQSSYNASPWGTSSSQSSSSFSQQQSSQAVQAFQPVLGLLGQMQGSISGGAMSQSAASSYVNQLASQLQPAGTCTIELL